MWKTVKLGDICEFRQGIQVGKNLQKKEPEEKSDVRFLRITDFTQNNEPPRYIDFPGEKYLVKKNDVSLVRYGNPGFVCRGIEGVIANNLFKVIPKTNELNNNFLYWFLKSPFFQGKIGAGKTGVAMQAISFGTIKGIEINLPSIPVQKQIVEKLDAAFADIDKAISATEKNIENISFLLESFSNKYMFDNRNNFKTALIGDLFDLSTGGTPSKKKSEYFSDGDIPWLVSGDIHQQEIIDCAGRITEEGYKNSSAKFLPINSVLIALNGQGKTRGTVAMLKIKATCNQSLVSIYPKNSKTILPEYLYFNLKNRYSEIRRITGDSGNDRRGLNMPLIRKISFSYPENLEEQSKYIEKSKNLISHVNYLNEKYEKKLINFYNLKNSILNQAFSGELTKDVA